MSRELRLPCPTCNGDQFVSHRDRHVENRTERCPNPDCYEGKVPARTGETPQTSAGPGTDALLSEVQGAVGQDTARDETSIRAKILRLCRSVTKDDYLGSSSEEDLAREIEETVLSDMLLDLALLETTERRLIARSKEIPTWDREYREIETEVGKVRCLIAEVRVRLARVAD